MFVRALLLIPVFLISLVLTLVLVGSSFPEGRQIIAKTWKIAQSRYERVLYEKTISVEGNALLSALDVTSALPIANSVPWWWTHGEEMAAVLSKNSLVQQAQIERCGVLSWGCFRVTIAEREPSLIAMVGDRAWVIGEDGGFITPVPTDQAARAMIRRTSGEKFRPPLVLGLHVDGISSDVIRARFLMVKGAIATIESRTGLRVEKVDLHPSGELQVWFAMLPFPAVFESGAQDQSQLEVEADRLLRVLTEIKGREATVEKVDLAFDKLAVVALKQDEAAVATKPAELGAIAHRR